ncbi:metal-dependent hydrolase, partial [Candidatus Micrarchaeota archaeon]|nr:metal-dependent hydrolase [Candidatus Micrarchaeota archaeon]
QAFSNVLANTCNMKLTYLGHSAFLAEINGKKLLFDPWIIGNTSATLDINEIKSLEPDLVFISHGHKDHGFKEAIDITKNTNAKAVGVFELVNALKEKGGKGIGTNIGGRLNLDGVEIYVTHAQHSCPYSSPCGFVVKYERKTIYHAGDTALTKDMAILTDLFDLDIAMVPIGGHFTMGLTELPLFNKMVKSKKYVGMHYNTFNEIGTDLNKAKQFVEIMEPGESCDC